MFLYINMVSAARGAQYIDWATAWTFHGSNSDRAKRFLLRSDYRFAEDISTG
jgi:hypothetical protein